MINNNTLEMRVRTLEQYVFGLRHEIKEVLEASYKQAINDNDELTAAECARKLRNHILEETDNSVVLDRINIDTTNDNSLRESLNSVINSDMSNYRQALRDIPEQEGFPLNINWPVNPITGKTGVLDDEDDIEEPEE